MVNVNLFKFYGFLNYVGKVFPCSCGECKVSQSLGKMFPSLCALSLGRMFPSLWGGGTLVFGEEVP